MAATPVEPHQSLDPAALARYEALGLRMPQIAQAIESFADPALRERAYYELVGILNPSPDEPDTVDVIAVPEPDRDFAARQIGELSVWVIEKAPTAWREAARLDDSTAANVIDMLTRGADAWTQMLLVKHALMTAGGFSAEQVDGDLAPLIREMAADAPVSPEVEELALRLKTNAEPGETAVQVALRLMRELHLDKPDERGDSRAAQPDSITAAVDAYERERGL